jgi:CMP-N-acetylneuraminate monooxygenase
MTHHRLRLGRVDEFPQLPHWIALGAESYFLVRDGDTFRLLSTTCPHQGGAVADAGDRFECPLHGWRFNRLTGRCLNAPSRQLRAYHVALHEDVLYAELPDTHAVAVPHRRYESKVGLTMQLHAHACLEIAHDGFTLLTDPWLDGPAFLGAWAQYPPPMVGAAELQPDAILITHEHSDHFHEPTLRHFQRDTPILVPDFPNERLPRRLRALGFTNVRTLRFGEATRIRDGWTVTTFEPESYWNDAFVLIEVDGFRIFDINDAGVNTRIARMVSPVDVLAVQFSAGASGYPWTWQHLTDAQKIAISEQACAGKLKLIRDATSLYGAGAVIPFASHFTLWHPSHRAYVAMMKRNTLGDVRTTLRDLPVDVIDLLPGDRWDVGRGVILRERDDDPFTAEAMTRYLDTAVPPDVFAAQFPSDESLTRDELRAYFDRLNRVPDIALCEDLTFSVHAAGQNPASLDFAAAIRDGHLEILETVPVRPNLTIEVPRPILTAIVRQELSWDEAFIGYWCRFDRHPNVYHAGFWRLLQAPYFKRAVDTRPSPVNEVARTSTVAELLESHGAAADRILRRYGLYCHGCHHSTSESLEMAARQHGLDEGRLELMLKQLKRAIADTTTSRPAPTNQCQ